MFINQKRNVEGAVVCGRNGVRYFIAVYNHDMRRKILNKHRIPDIKSVNKQRRIAVRVVCVHQHFICNDIFFIFFLDLRAYVLYVGVWQRIQDVL